VPTEDDAPTDDSAPVYEYEEEEEEDDVEDDDGDEPSYIIDPITTHRKLRTPDDILPEGS
jgi:hypothetical protein